MSLTLPLRSDLEDYDLQVTLDGVLFTLRFRWNRREQCWYMDVGGENGRPILASIKVVIDYPLGARSRNALMPAGMFVAVDTTSQRLDPGLNDLGVRVLLLYFEVAELPIDPTKPLAG